MQMFLGLLVLALLILGLVGLVNPNRVLPQAWKPTKGKAAGACFGALLVIVLAGSCTQKTPEAGPIGTAETTTGTGETAAGGSAGPVGTATVALTLSARATNGIVSLAGTTDLPDGTWIAHEVKDQEFLNRPGNVPQEKMIKEGDARVEGGTYSATVDVSAWPATRVEVWVAFQTIVGGGHVQPPGVLERFGELGEKLQGPNVTMAGNSKRVELSQLVSLR